MVDANFQATVYLKNIVETSSITVTPVLHLSNGSVYKLAAVQLEPSGIATVDINASLQSLGIAPNATLSGWVELQYNWAWAPLCAYIRDLDATHSLIFTFGFDTPESLSPGAQHKAGSQVTEGMWWKQESNVTGFLALANTTSKAITAVVDVSNDHASVLGSYTITVSPQGMKTLDIQEIQSASAGEGGIRVSYAGEPDGLLVAGRLEDPGVGYSANLPFAPPAHPMPPMAHATPLQGIAELGLMTGASDPYMHFPAGTNFTPYSLLRNVSSAPVSVTPTLWWMQGSAPKSLQLPQFQLAPFATHSLDVPSLLASAGLKDFSGSVNLEFDTKGQRGLLMAAGSVDQTNTYVFEVAPRALSPSAGKSLSYWSTGNGDDTMVTIWNPADEAQSFIFRIHFSGGHYDRLVNLGPRATYMFDLSEILAVQGPDSDGNVLPSGLQEGSAEIVGIEADNQNILVALDAGVYNVRKATCFQQCTTCNGATSYLIALSPFAVGVGSAASEQLQAQWNTGAQYNYTSSATWSSSNTSVATVPSPGQVQGVAAGTATVSASISNVPVFANTCNPYPICPIYGGGGGQAPGNVAPSISGPNTVWWFNGQNPAPSAYPISVTLTSSTGSSTSWAVTQSDTKVNLSSTTGAQITVTSTGSHFSSQIGDISITATANGQPSAPFTMTAKTPWKLAPAGPQTFCNPSPESYSTELTYNLKDNLNATMSTDIAWNESVGTASCQNGSNWCNYTIGTSGGFTNPLTDVLGPPALNFSPIPKPAPTCNGQALGTTRYRAIPQTISVGTDTSGGVIAQTDTLGYYIDHGQHDSIQIPNQPSQ